MKIKTTKEIGEDYNYSTKDHSKKIKNKWVEVEGLIYNLKTMRELIRDDNLNTDDFDNFIKELERKDTSEIIFK